MRPEKLGQAAALAVELDGRSCVVDRRLDLAPVTDDARVIEQTQDIRLPEAGHRRRIEVGEGRPETLAFPQDGEPRESRLETFETEFLEERSLVGDRATPLDVVVHEVVGRRHAPGTTQSIVVSPMEVVGRIVRCGIGHTVTVVGDD